MPGIDVKMGSYGERGRGPQLSQDRYNSEDSLEDNQSSTSSTESRQSDFQKKDHEFIPTRSSGILASKPAYNPGQFTRVNSNPLLISAQKQLLLVEEVRKKKKEIKVGEETPEWQSNLDSWKHRRRKQSEEALSRVSEIRRIEEQEIENGLGTRKLSIGKKISLSVLQDDEIDLDDLPSDDTTQRTSQDREVLDDVKEEDSLDPEVSTSQTSAFLSSKDEIASWATEESTTSSSHHRQLNGETVKLSDRINGEHHRPDSDSVLSQDPAPFRSGEDKDTTDRRTDTSSISFRRSEERTTFHSAKEDRSSYQSAKEERSSYQSTKEDRSSYQSTKEDSSPHNGTKEDRNPYQSAIESYKSFAQSHLSGESSQEEWIESEVTEVVKQETVNQEKKITQTFSSRITGRWEESATPPRSTEDSSTPPITPSRIQGKWEEQTPPSSLVSTLSPASPARTSLTGPTSMTSVTSEDGGAEEKGSPASKDEEWESKIERYVQPARKSSTELSDKMRLKLASFQEQNPAKPESTTTTPSPRLIQSDNKFKDKLKVFKSIETNSSSSSSSSYSGAGAGLNRRESEPVLPRPLAGAYKPFRSTSSSALMNTIQNNKFFQQNSLSSDGDDSIGDKLLDDALEESFSKLEEKNKPVFSAEDLLPSTERLAPPSEKPPPPPPTLPPQLDEETLREEALAKQEREIIENLEREEREKKTRNEMKMTSPVKPSVPPPTANQSISTSTQIVTQISNSFNSSSSTVLPQSAQMSSSSSQTKPNPSAAPVHVAEKSGLKIHHSRTSSSIQEDGYLPAGHMEQPQPARKPVSPTKPEINSRLPANMPALPSMQNIGQKQDSEYQGRKRQEGAKDFTKHWLVQEAEHRRINEAKLKQNVEKLENINNNVVAGGQVNQAASSPVNQAVSSPVKPPPERRENIISENIYANIDPTNINYSRNSGYVPPLPGMQIPPEKGPGAPAPRGPQGPGASPPRGPQVPPRAGDGQDRVLSVSGKKKCSACKDELGRGAAMIIESLRLFYHIRCFKCCVCSVQLGNGEHGTDVRVRNNRLHCQNCYSNDEGLKFSKV